MQFGIYDNEFDISVPHLTIARESEVNLHLRAIRDCHVKVRLDAKSLGALTLQRNEEVVVEFEDVCPSRVTLIVKLPDLGEFTCALPLSWIQV